MYDKISIKQYQAIYSILKRETKDFIEDVDKNVDLLHELTGKKKEDILKLSPSQLVNELKKFEFIFKLPELKSAPLVFKVKGYWFKVNYDIGNLKAKDLIGLSEIGKDEKSIVENLHRIVSAYCIPLKRFWIIPTRLTEAQKQLVISNMDIQTAFNISAFFLKLSQRLSVVTKDFLETQTTIQQKKLMEEIFSNIGDG